MNQDLQISRALSVLERLAAAMCRNPDKLRMNATSGFSTVEIQFVAADTVDTKRLVGTRGSRLDNFSELVRLMMQDTGKHAIIGKVLKDSEAECKFTAFKAIENWPRKFVHKLFQDTVDACFVKRKNPTRLEDSKVSETTRCYAAFHEVGPEELYFAQVANEIFVPIGIQQGRRLIVEVEKVL